MSGIYTNGLPSAVTPFTGLETIPADTNVASGGGAETVKITTQQLGINSPTYAEPLTGATIVVPAGQSALVLNPADTIAALTVTLPPNPYDGQIFRIGSSATVTALTLNTSDSSTIKQNPTALTVSTTAPYGYEFVFRALTAAGAALNAWIRLQ